MRALVVLALLVASVAPALAAEPYAGPLIDAHSHLPGLQALDALIAAMDRHKIGRVALLGVGGIQKDDAAWIEAAARRHPDRVIPLAPVPDPMAADAAKKLDGALASGRFKGAGEVHIHQASRKIRRAIDAPPVLALLDVCARHGVPLVVHDELTPETTAELERALAHNRQAMIVVAHAGSGEPRALAGLLGRHPNLWLDISGMTYIRTPALATESGPLERGMEGAPHRALGQDPRRPRRVGAGTVQARDPRPADALAPARAGRAAAGGRGADRPRQRRALFRLK